jgi:class 3 adenylate cyclase
MSLRNKLFLGIGSLLLILAIFSFYTPRYFIKQDLLNVHTYFEEEINRQNQKAKLMWENMFNSRLVTSIEIVNSSLNYFLNYDELKKLLKSALDEVVKDEKLIEEIREEKQIKNINDRISSRLKQFKSVNFLDGNVREKSIQLALMLMEDLELQDFQAAAIVGNLLAEGFITGKPNMQEGMLLGPPPAYGSKNIGYGWAQWTNTVEGKNEDKDRLNMFIKRLKGSPQKQGNEATDGDNYSYLIHELLFDPLYKKALIQLKESENYEDATLIICKEYLVACKKKTSLRIKKRMELTLGVLNNLRDLNTNQGIKSDRFSKLNKTIQIKKDVMAHDFIKKAYVEHSTAGQLSHRVYDRAVKQLKEFISKIGFKQNVLKLIDENPQIDFIQLSRGDQGFTYLNLNQDDESRFFFKALFKDKEYFEHNFEGVNQLSEITLIDSSYFKRNYLGNTIRILDGEGSLPIYLTFGRNFFSDIVGSLLIDNAIAIFLSPDGTYLNALNDKTHILDKSLFAGMNFNEFIEKGEGIITWNGEPYSYFGMSSPMDIPVKTFILIPNSQEPMYQMKETISNNLIEIYKMLSTQLLSMVLFFFAIAMIYLAGFSKRIASPITMLANATKQIANGSFENITLPKVKDSETEISVLTTGFKEMIISLEDREKIRELLDKVVSKEIAKEILSGKVELGGEEREVTILFADIRGFTSLTKDADPKVVLKYLNEYITMMSEIIEKEGGVIDKYIGDAIMALYGAPVSSHDSAKKAIITAINMMKSLQKWNKDRKEKIEKEIFIGIGIHTGKVVAGNMGTLKRLNYTVLGANVNLASRLCAAAKPMEIRISKETLQKSGIKDNLIYKSLPSQIYKGFIDPIETYAIEDIKESL